MDAELLKLFDNSAISDEESLDTLLNEIDTQESQYKETMYNDLIQQLQPSAALKLLNFIGPDNKEYKLDTSLLLASLRQKVFSQATWVIVHVSS